MVFTFRAQASCSMAKTLNADVPSKVSFSGTFKFMFYQFTELSEKVQFKVTKFSHEFL